MNDPLGDLLPAGQQPGDPFLKPYVLPNNSFRLEGDEALVHSGNYFVEIHVYAAARSSGKKQWHSTTPFRKRGFAAFTTDRLLFSWPRFRSDPGAGSLFERLSIRYIERSEGTVYVFGGHLRHQWFGHLFVRKSKGWKGESGITIQTEDRDGTEYRVALTPLAASFAQSIGRDVLRTVAARRLEAWPEVTDEARVALQALSDGTAAPIDRGWALDYSIPGGRRVGFDFPARTATDRPEETGASRNDVALLSSDRLCVTGTCEARGLPTQLAVCDLCGRPTAPVAEPPAASSAAAVETEATEDDGDGVERSLSHVCISASCEARGLPTQLPICDLCGQKTLLQ